MLSKDYRKLAWSKLTGKWGQMIGVTVIFSLLCYVINAIPTVGSIISFVIGGPLVVALAAIFLKLIREEETKVENLFDYFKHFGNTAILYITNNIFIALWSLLFVIPGIIKFYAYSMSYYIMAENPEMTAAQAREASMRLMMGNKGRLFYLHFSFIGWYLLSMLTFGILLLWVNPYVRAAEAAFYESIKPATEQPIVEE